VFVLLSTDSEFFHPINKGAPANVEIPGCLRLIPVEFFQAPDDEIPLNPFQTDASRRQIELNRVRVRSVALEEVGEVGEANLVAHCENYQPFNHVLQLTNITWPSIPGKVRRNEWNES
jgi:hypothetical protein